MVPIGGGGGALANNFSDFQTRPNLFGGDVSSPSKKIVPVMAMFGRSADDKSYYSDLLPFKMLASSGDVACTSDGGMLAAVSLTMPDYEILSKEEHQSIVNSLHQEFAQLLQRDGNWSIYFSAKRVAISRYTTEEQERFSDKDLCYWLDLERAAQFSEEERFATVFRVAIKRKSSTLSRSAGSILKFVANPNETQKDENDFREEFKDFQTQIASFVAAASRILLSAKRLVGSEFLSYLHSSLCPMGYQHVQFEHNNKPNLFLDAYLANCALLPDLSHPQIDFAGDKYYLGAVSIKNYPPLISPAFADMINLLAFECAYSVRFAQIPEEKFRVSLAMRRSVLAAGARKIMTFDADLLAGEHLNEDAIDDSINAKAAEKAANAGEIFGNMSVQYIVWDKDLQILKEKLTLLEEHCRRRGIVAQRESFESTGAFLGTIPGNDEHNLRKEICTLENAVYLMPLLTTWEGTAVNNVVPNGPPLIYAQARGNTPFMFSPHSGIAGDNSEAGTGKTEKSTGGHVGHTMIVGQTGGGKSTALIFLTMQFAKYGGRVFFFDKRRTALAATICSGGRHHDFGSFQSKNVGVQPLRYLDTPEDLATTDLWVRYLLADRNIKADEADFEEITNTLNLLKQCKINHRTLINFQRLIQSKTVKKALGDYTEGNFSSIFGGDGSGSLGDAAWWTTFEIGEVLNNPEISRPLLRFLFAHITRSLGDVPTLIVVDEAYDFLSDEYFVGKFDEMLRQFRKLNAWVLMATQASADLLNNPKISTTITNNIINRIYLPSPEISQEKVRNMLRELHLTDAQLDLLQHAQIKRDYLFQTSHGVKLATLDLRHIALAFCCAGDSSDVTQAVKMQKEQKLNPHEWMKYKDVPKVIIDACSAIV